LLFRPILTTAVDSVALLAEF